MHADNGVSDPGERRGKNGEKLRVRRQYLRISCLLGFLHIQPLTSSPVHKGWESLGQRGTGMRWVLATRQIKQYLRGVAGRLRSRQ